MTDLQKEITDNWIAIQELIAIEKYRTEIINQCLAGNHPYLKEDEIKKEFKNPCTPDECFKQ